MIIKQPTRKEMGGGQGLTASSGKGRFRLKQRKDGKKLQDQGEVGKKSIYVTVVRGRERKEATMFLRQTGDAKRRGRDKTATGGMHNRTGSKRGVLYICT